MSPTSPIAAALAQLQLERENLAARLTKVDAAIATMRDLFHLPTNSQPRKAQTRKTKIPEMENGHSKGAKVKAAIRAALKDGPVTTADLAAQLRIEKGTAGYHVRQMVADGVVKFIGAGRATTIALAGAPAKEAP